MKLGAVAALIVAGVAAAHSDTLKQVTSSSGLSANDTLAWWRAGSDGTVLPVGFTVATARGNSASVSMGAANSIISVVCTATPCSWTGTGLTAGDFLLWSSDAGNGGSGPVTISFGNKVSGVGALIQADLPGAFTGQIQVFNGATVLATYTAASDPAGDPVYLGALDQTGPNITKVVFSLTTCASLCTDFGLDTVSMNVPIGPVVKFTPTSLPFGAAVVGTTTTAQVVTVNNSGTAALTISSIAINGTNATSFLELGTCGSSLAAGASCQVFVAFKPTTGGSLMAGLYVTDNAAGSPQSVSLSGTGTGVPTLKLSTTNIAFPVTLHGTTSAATTVTLTNLSGTTTINFSSIALTGANPSDFLELNSCGLTLAPSASCSVIIAFKPAAAASYSASLSITDNAVSSPQSVSLTGTGN